MKLKFHAARKPFSGGIELSMVEYIKRDGFVAVAMSISMEETRDSQIVSPFLNLAYEDAQNLMDELYHCGVRPTEGAGTAGSMKATQNHLEDMRAIVATKLNVPFKIVPVS
tara:strand:- start:2719 stop:3051 length:333 start_codon:yes stop_codon:yes gene_type:complete